MKVNLGDTVRCDVTGFEGIVTGRVRYLSKCVQVLVQPPLGPDGAYRDALWFDEPRVTVVGSGVEPQDYATAAG